MQRFLLVAAAMGALEATSCGIDFYVYLEPVPTASYSYLDQVTTFELPSNQVGGGYFSEYQIFYKIYTSATFGGSSLNVDSASELIAIRQELYDDYAGLRTFTTGDSTPTNLYNIFNSRHFYSATFAEPVVDPSTDSRSAYPLGESAKGGARIDFNLSAIAYGHPVLQVNGIPYRILRALNIDTQNSKRDFLYSPGIRDVDVTGQNEPYAYAIFYIVAYGTTEVYAPIYSKPTFLGIFKLPNA